MKGLVCFVISVTSFLLLQVRSDPVDLSPKFLFGSIRNATLDATSFISNSLQKQSEIIIQAKDTASDYISNAVAVPKNILINAKDATRDYIDSTASSGIEIKVKSLMEIFRANMPYGISFLDLPVLEPLKLGHLDFDINHKEIGNISSTLDNVTISKLSTFVVDHVKLSLVDGMSLAMNLSVPTIHVDGMYRISGMLGSLFAVNGSGPFDLEINGSKCYVHTVLGYSKTMYVRSLDLDFSIESLNAVFHNLFPDPNVDDTVNQVISDMAPEMLDVIKPELRPKLEEIMAQRLNATVARLTMGHVMGILTGTADINSFADLTVPKLSV